MFLMASDSTMHSIIPIILLLLLTVSIEAELSNIPLEDPLVQADTGSLLDLPPFDAANIQLSNDDSVSQSPDLQAVVPACNTQSSSDDLNKPLDQSWNSNVLRIRQDAGAALNKVVNFFRGDPQEKPGATCPTKSTPPLDKGSSPDPQMIKSMIWTGLNGSFNAMTGKRNLLSVAVENSFRGRSEVQVKPFRTCKIARTVRFFTFLS